MVDSKKPRLIGSFIRQRREALGLSQRALGLLFTPPVTTQFISNVERGVTPLPPAHVPILSRALAVPEGEIMTLLEREYTLKLSGRLGLEKSDLPAHTTDGATLMKSLVENAGGKPALSVANHDYDFMRNLYDAYQKADPKTKQAFATACEDLLSLRLRSELQKG